MEYNPGFNAEKSEVIKKRFEGSNLTYQEHLARYGFIKQFVQEKFVLEVGCGIGDGTHELSLLAKRIIGTELDKNSLKSAYDNFGNLNIDYIVMNGCLLGFKDNLFDVVISLEVIEHLEEQDKFLLEIRRVLKKEGIAVISTPNKEIIKREGTRLNPQHIRELTFNEFRHLLKKYFNAVELFGQRRGRGIVGLGGVIHGLVRSLDLFKIRKLFPQEYKKNIADKLAKNTGAKNPAEVTKEDLIISDKKVAGARNIIAVCRKLAP